MDVQQLAEKVHRDYYKNEDDMYVLGSLYGVAEVEGYERVVYLNDEGEYAYYASDNTRKLLPPGSAEQFPDEQVKDIESRVKRLDRIRQEAIKQHGKQEPSVPAGGININLHQNQANDQTQQNQQTQEVGGFGVYYAQKSKVLALVFAILPCFFWLGGIHRFYTGHIGTGFLQLITLGGLGIWQIIDILSILGGTFRDGNGQPLN